VIDREGFRPIRQSPHAGRLQPLTFSISLSFGALGRVFRVSGDGVFGGDGRQGGVRVSVESREVGEVEWNETPLFCLFCFCY